MGLILFLTEFGIGAYLAVKKDYVKQCICLLLLVLANGALVVGPGRGETAMYIRQGISFGAFICLGLIISW